MVGMTVLSCGRELNCLSIPSGLPGFIGHIDWQKYINDSVISFISSLDTRIPMTNRIS